MTYRRRNLKVFYSWSLVHCKVFFGKDLNYTHIWCPVFRYRYETHVDIFTTPRVCPLLCFVRTRLPTTQIRRLRKTKIKLRVTMTNTSLLWRKFLISLLESLLLVSKCPTSFPRGPSPLSCPLVCGQARRRPRVEQNGTVTRDTPRVVQRRRLWR